MAPLIAPLQGLSIAMTVGVAALGLVGPKESVSPGQWRGMAYTIGGFVLCAWYGPSQDAEDAFWPLIRHHYNPWFQLYAVISYGTSIFYLLAQSDRSPLRFMLPPKGSVALPVAKGIGSSKQDLLTDGSRLSAIEDGPNTCHQCKSSLFQCDRSAVSDTCSRS